MISIEQFFTDEHINEDTWPVPKAQVRVLDGPAQDESATKLRQFMRDKCYNMKFFKALTLTLSANHPIMWMGRPTPVYKIPATNQVRHYIGLLDKIKYPKKGFIMVLCFEFTDNNVIHAHGVITTNCKTHLVNVLSAYRRVTDSFTYLKNIDNTNKWEDYILKETEFEPYIIDNS